MAIGTAAAIGLGVAGAASAATGVIGSNRQAQATQEAADASIAEQRRQFDTAVELTQPRRDAENAALAELQTILGIGTGEGFQGTPGFQFGLDHANEAVERRFASQGGRFSGNVANALQENAIGLANQNYINAYLNPVLGLATGNAGLNTANQAIATGQGISGTLEQAGAQRASAIGDAFGSVNNAFQGTLSNVLFAGI